MNQTTIRWYSITLSTALGVLALVACGGAPGAPETDTAADPEAVSAADPSENAAPQGGAIDFCFGASGSNCDECWGDDGRGNVTCAISVGSQLHDSCCSSFPNGVGCGGDKSQSNHCGGEWNHALNDVGASRNWTRTFNKHQGTRRPTTLAQFVNVSCDGNTEIAGRRTNGSIQAPSGSAIWHCDLLLNASWCANGYTRRWDGQYICN